MNIGFFLKKYYNHFFEEQYYISLSICFFLIEVWLTLIISLKQTTQWFNIYDTWQIDHHNKSSYHPSPYRVIIVLLTVFPMLYIISHSLFIL